MTMVLSERDSAGGGESACRAQLAQLWEKNLGVAVSRDDDYFQMGGNSLLGTQLIAWIHERFGVELSLLDLFESPTVSAQARLVLAAQGAARPAGGKAATEYFHFGPKGAQLFGALHRPASSAGKAGVVLCYPIGQEYMRVHRTYVELARSLAASGHCVLRFDYFGCGDSAGETASGSLEHWRENIREAIRELRARTAVSTVCLLGSRAGANLVLDIGAGHSEVTGMVLWEPILDGAAYLADLQRAHHRLLDSNAVLDGYEQHPLANGVLELVGFPFTKTLHDEVAAIDLLAGGPCAAMPDSLVLAHAHKPALERFAAAQPGGTTDYTVVDETDAIWLKADDQNKGAIPAHAIQAIVSWIAGRGT